MGILVITVDLQCCRCKTKIKNVLECLREDYRIEKIEFEDKANKVIVRGKFDVEKLCNKIWCKACNVVKAIIIVDVWPPPPAKTCPTKPPPPPKTCLTKPPKTRPQDPEPPKPTYKFVPHPYPVPYPMQCRWNCHPQQCRCCPATPPPEQKPSECSQSQHHGGCGCGWKPAPPPPCYCSNQGGCSCSNYSTWWPPLQPFFPPPWSTDFFEL